MKYLTSIALSVFMLMLLTTTLVYADDPDYPDYLGGNKNLILISGKMGYAKYLDKKSVVVKKYAPPVYKLTVTVLSAREPGRGVEITGKRKIDFLYKWDTRKMYIYVDNSWKEIEPAQYGYQEFAHMVGEMAFYIAYHKKFYGDIYTSPDYYSTEYVYVRVDGAE